VRATERDGVIGVDEVEVGERVRREELHADASGIHLCETDRRVHVEAPAVPNSAERVPADAEPLLAVDLEQLRTVTAGRTEHEFEHDMRMEIDHLGPPPVRGGRP
jgi:hypothetical protein